VRQPDEARASFRSEPPAEDRFPGEIAGPRLAHLKSAAEVLERLAGFLGPGVQALELARGPAEPDATWRRVAEGPRDGRRITIDLPGDPPWRLSAEVRSTPSEAPPRIGVAAWMLESWREARAEIDHAEERITARARELEMLQAVGRRAAAARDAPELVAAVADALDRSGLVDCVVATFAVEGGRAAVGFWARPFAAECTARIERAALRFDGREPVGGAPQAERRQLQSYDAQRPPRAHVDEQELLLLPLERPGQLLGCLVAVPSAPPDDASLRLLYGAANQLAMHLERILAVERAEADRFRAMVEAMPHGVLLIDPERRVLQANRAASAMLGPVDRIDAALDRLGLGALIERALDRGAVAPHELHPPGGQVWSASASAMLGRGGACLGAVLVISDVTESQRLQQELAQSEKMSSLGQMISGVAHELNNPLSSIVGYAQLLRATERPADERMVQRLEVLGREAERCKQIVHGLLSFARRHEPERRAFSLNEAVQSVLSLLAYQLRVDGVRLETEFDARLGLVVGDRHRIEQVVVNLVTNARQALRGIARAGAVRVRTHAAGPCAACLEVQDDGPGIPEELRSRVFDPFFTTKEPGEGTGLGLSLVYGIVRAHGGQVELVRQAEPGTTVRVTLPLDAATRATPPRAPEATPLPAPRRARILVVDDDEPVARLIGDALEADGHATVRCASAGEALARLAGERFDLLITDLRMPGRDGLGLIEEAARLQPGLRGRALLLTGDSLGQDVVPPAGIAVLIKPFDLEELRRQVGLRLGSRAGD
jgi:two-component system, NtrC family, sensor kinase